MDREKRTEKQSKVQGRMLIAWVIMRVKEKGIQGHKQKIDMKIDWG